MLRPDGAGCAAFVPACRGRRIADDGDISRRRRGRADRLGGRIVHDRTRHRRRRRAPRRSRRRLLPLPPLLRLMPSLLIAKPVPRTHLPAIAGTLVVLIALPVFLIA